MAVKVWGLFWHPLVRVVVTVKLYVFGAIIAGVLMVRVALWVAPVLVRLVTGLLF